MLFPLKTTRAFLPRYAVLATPHHSSSQWMHSDHPGKPTGHVDVSDLPTCISGGRSGMTRLDIHFSHQNSTCTWKKKQTAEQALFFVQSLDAVLCIVERCLNRLWCYGIIISFPKVLTTEKCTIGIPTLGGKILPLFGLWLEKKQIETSLSWWRVKTCLAKSGWVMAKEGLGPINILNIRGFLSVRVRNPNWWRLPSDSRVGKTEKLHSSPCCNKALEQRSKWCDVPSFSRGLPSMYKRILPNNTVPPIQHKLRPNGIVPILSGIFFHRQFVWSQACFLACLGAFAFQGHFAHQEALAKRLPSLKINNLPAMQLRGFMQTLRIGQWVHFRQIRNMALKFPWVSWYL